MKTLDPRRCGIRGVFIGAAAAALLTALVASAGAGLATTKAGPQNTAPPTISGTPQVGKTLTASTGQWTPTPSGYLYQWRRCSRTGGSCASISGAASKTYTLTSADAGNTLRVRVTARIPSGETSSTSVPSAVIRSAPKSAPRRTASPRISGTAQQGQTLTVSNGGWSGVQPITYSYQWLRCDSNGDGCVDIVGAKSQTYTPTGGDVGQTLRARVTARNGDGSSSATTVPTAVVTKGSAPGGSAISISDVSLPNRLIVDRVSFTPNPLRSRTTVIGRFRISDSRDHRVQGALVYVLALPYGLFRTAPEVVSGADGYATVQLRPTSQLVIRRGAVVFFVRARKAGENLLGGVSTRRLVQLNLG